MVAQKNFDFKRSNNREAKETLRRYYNSWAVLLDHHATDFYTRRKVIERAYQEFEIFFSLDVVDRCVPSNKECSIPEDSSLDDDREKLRSMLSSPDWPEHWYRAFKFAKERIEGTNFVKKIQTKMGRKLFKREDIAEYLNEQWAPVPCLEGRERPQIAVKRHENMYKFLMSEGYLREKLETLPFNKSTGPSIISNEMLRLICPKAVAPFMYKMYNYCLTNGVLPSNWLVTQVTPSYKGKGSASDEDNYRPISVTPVFARILEQMLAEYLYKVFDEENTIHLRQHGHRKGYSNESQLACFLEERSQFARDGGQVDCIKLDLKSATSFVDHELLLEKLKQLPIDNRVFDVIKRFVTGREQEVRIGNYISRRRPLRQGLPQGSPLTNPLFLLYVDDGFNTQKNNSRIRGCGDDFLLYKRIMSKDDQWGLQEDLNALQEYFDRSHLKINFKKVSVLSFFSKNKCQTYLHHSYRMYDRKVERVTSMEYLGVTLSADLSFHAHVSGLIDKYTPQFNDYMNMFSLCTAEVKEHLYKLVLRPKLEMCSSVWELRHNYTEDSLIADLERLQQRFAAYVLGKEFFPESWHPSWRENLEELNWEPLMARRIHNRLKLVEKFKKLEKGPKADAEMNQCLLELLYMQAKGNTGGNELKSKKGCASWLDLGLQDRRKMRRFFQENPYEDLDIDECCAVCPEMYCKYAAEQYDSNRSNWVQELKIKGPQFIAKLASKHPYGIHTLVK